MKKTMLFALAALAPLAIASAVRAADEAPIATAPETPVTASEVVVQAQIAYRNRSEQTAPTLEYGLDYFQRFEPLTAGDALKRVPSVAFLSDILESDGVRMRGLDPGYTQVLINGEKVPGAGVDRSFFVDRIPAELIERIEVVRSASANRSGDAVAGALNIVLRDAYALDGGFFRVGALGFNDGRIRETVGGVWGGQVGPGRLLLGANVQGRRNPKEKSSLRYTQPPAGAATFVNREDQTDLRNGTDYSFNASYQTPLAGGDLDLSAFYVKTDRKQDERSLEFNTATGGSLLPIVFGKTTGGALLTLNAQVVDIEQENTTLSGKYAKAMLGGVTKVKLGYARFTEHDFDREDDTDWNRSKPRYTLDRTITDLEDTETSAKIEHERDLGAAKLEFGVQYQDKNRDTDIITVRNRFNIGAANPNGAYAPVAGGVNTIEETRIDPYAMLSGKAGDVKWEAGLRYETTDVSIEDATAPAASRKTDLDYAVLLPSAHLRWNLTGEDRVSLSVARTLRRPGFDQVSPAVLTEEYGDNDFIGNPNLKPETAWGLDAGYERRLGRQGVAGLNIFYRDVKDLIELADTGAVGSAGGTARVLQARNVGDGQVWGAEFDLSTPLTVIGLKDTGVFFNYSWLDSDISDTFGGRKFNDQSKYVLNVGFIQDLPQLGGAFGATYRKQGKAQGRLIGEEVTTTYGGDLEVFVEKRIGEKLTVRLTGSNLLNAKKEESFNKFDSTADQRARAFAEYELESEEAGPVFQLIARMAF
jgi:outer membrane receptor protein involved in Fe transport